MIDRQRNRPPSTWDDVPQVIAPGWLTDTSRVTTSTLADDVAELYSEAQLLLLSKHADYGPLNIANAPGGALNGLRVRMHDKLSRLNHLHDKGGEAQHETLRDTLLDLANYALIGCLVVDGNWPAS